MKNYEALLAQGLSEDETSFPDFEGYTIQRKLGQGGMGAVYLAIDEELEREIAIKVFTNQSADPMNLERVRQESDIMARIQHRNVISIYKVISSEQSFCLVLEYAAAGDLSRKIAAEGSLEHEQMVKHCSEICDGLEQIHQLGIIHRDIKPANILLTSQGVAKVADLGIAKDTAAESLTMTGSYLGSMMYVAPEQMTASSLVDARADIWAMGILIYEMLTGNPPKAVLESELMEPLPEAIRPIVRRCLKQNPENRYPNVMELKADLLKSLEPKHPQALPAKKLSLKTLLITSSILIIAATSIAIFSPKKEQNEPKDPAPTTASEETIDLINLLHSPLQPDRGTWQIKNDNLRCQTGNKVACISFPVDALGNSYDLSFNVVRHQGRYSAAVYLPTSIGNVTFDLDGWGSRQSGIQALDKQDLRHHSQGFRFGMENGTSYQLRLEVRENYVDAYIDGKKVNHCNLTGKTGSIIANWDIPRKHAISLAAWQSEMTFSKIKLKKIP